MLFFICEINGDARTFQMLIQRFDEKRNTAEELLITNVKSIIYKTSIKN